MMSPAYGLVHAPKMLRCASMGYAMVSQLMAGGRALAAPSRKPPLCAAMSSTSTVPRSSRKVFREYIGAQDRGVKFGEVPINQGVDFHFILGFAVDYKPSKDGMSPANGSFSEYWDTVNLTPKAVAAVKEANPRASVMLSVGGATLRGTMVEFAPKDEVSWVKNAVHSLSVIIDEYKLDGVDIDYEAFVGNSATFSRCIGNLLTKLKENKPNLITSIAPFHDTQRYYQELWNSHQDVIDYVNFQFYAYGNQIKEADYIQLYNNQAANFRGGKVLAAINTNNQNDAPNVLNRNVAMNACTTLNKRGNGLPGIFIWSADSSKSNEWKYDSETKAQNLLAGN